MAAVQGVMSAAERSMRSVFVGNIPYEATEEQLKDIFSEVGPVVSFRLVYDRETGKPKGYGFCEYKDQETALSAMRNLNGYELNGRALRVDNAASEKSKEELKNLQASLGGPPVESPYGPEVEPEKAPEAISKAVASLPPEQMFELMKQMKSCIQNNPNEARTMLLQNPQLAYALLQAQVIMRIVDPQVVLTMLQRQNPNPSTILQQAANASHPGANDVAAGMPPAAAIPNDRGPPPYGDQAFGMGGPASVGGLRGAVPSGPRGALLDRPPAGGDSIRQGPVPFGDPRAAREPFDPRLDPRSAMSDRDLRQMVPPVRDRDLRQPMMAMDRDLRDQDLRRMSPPPRGMADGGGYDSRFRGAPDPQRSVPPSSAPFDTHMGGGGRYGEQRQPFESRAREDPRVSQAGPGLGAQMRQPPTSRSGSASGVPSQLPGRQQALAPSAGGGTAGGGGVSPQDQEKAALIMQVLQLSDQQIALLPPEQRQSIMILKEQIARSTQQS